MTNSASCQPRSKIIVLILLAALFAVGIIAQFIIPQLYSRKATVPLPLSALLPDSAPGWQVQDLPLAATETLQLTVSNILRYDDTVFRVFTKGPISFGVYVSYWLPGKVSYYDAGVHTPDTCWVYNGWKRQSRTSGVPLKVGTERGTKPAEIGVFTKDHEVQHVAFWHLVGGRVNTYEQFGWHDGARGYAERSPNYIRDFLRYGLNQGQEQCFVRISSTVPINELLVNPEVATLLVGLRSLGLFEQTVSN